VAVAPDVFPLRQELEKVLAALFWGMGTFSACWLFHVVLWRIHRPQGYLIWLPTIFVVLPAFIALVLSFSGAATPESLARMDTWLPATALHLLISACYTCGYAGLTEYSPSAEVLKVVHQHMPKGVPPGTLHVRAFTEYSLTGKRIEHLVHSGMITIHDERVWLTPTGRRSATFCKNYRTLTGVSEYGAG
jgi:hypothetical protein